MSGRFASRTRSAGSSAPPIPWTIGWQVGYEEPAFFRRLFKRTTGITPGAYRRRFQVPAFMAGTASRPHDTVRIPE